MEIKPTPVVEIQSESLKTKQVRVFIKREDLNHPLISGNKARKMKYNLIKARTEGYDKLLTFGGAYSNHIYATAAAGKSEDFKTIGVIRGEETLPLNPTLQFAEDNGMIFHYMSRTDYRLKTDSKVISGLYELYGDFYLIPEGGSNKEAILGCAEMIEEVEDNYDYYCCSVGTGGTLAGIIQGLKGKGNIIGFSSLKGSFLAKDIETLLEDNGFKVPENWEINNEYHFGGYARFPEVIRTFMLAFEQKHGTPLDPIYTSKALYGIFDLIERDKIPSGSKVLFIHTGGIQGRKGFSL